MAIGLFVFTVYVRLEIGVLMCFFVDLLCNCYRYVVVFVEFCVGRNEMFLGNMVVGVPNRLNWTISCSRSCRYIK